jgi:2-keto-4-pentenoate hydratase/2-oxohepta-3-ene-1,7-dioic acid hydratase in catechol pathway
MGMVNRISMNVLAPALIFSALSSKSFDVFGDAPLILGSIGIVLGSGLLAWPFAKLLRQDARTPDLIFDLPTLIETCSRGITLLPGDIIATGTPAGVGMGLNPPSWLKHGDTVVVEIDGIGMLSNRFVDA